METTIESPDTLLEANRTDKKKGKKEMGFERIRLALERLQIAWLRFSITMIGLGFTAYRFFYSRIEDGKAPLLKVITGREIGMFLLFVGFIGLLQATIQHIKSHAKLKAYYPELRYSISLIQSYFVLALGGALFLMATFEL